MITRLRRRLKLWTFREEGTFSVEAIMMFPMLIWAYIAMFVFFEALREQNINLKAAYTVGDLLSRETELINMDYLNGMTKVFQWLTTTRDDVAIRVTVVRYDEESDSHKLIWSRGTNGKEQLVQGEVKDHLTPHIPILADADSAIIVETWAQYDPVLNWGLIETELNNLVVTAPRFTEQLGFEGLGDGGGSTHDDGTSGGTDLDTSGSSADDPSTGEIEEGGTDGADTT